MSFYNDLLINHLRCFNILNKSRFLTDYENNEEIRGRFEKCIRFPEHQVYVHISNSFSVQGIPFPRIYSLNISFNKLQQLLQDTRIEKIHTLHLHFYPSTESTTNLILPENYGIKTLIISTYNVRVSIIPPHSLETLTVRGPCLHLPLEFNDVFSHLHELELTDVKAISDVRMFVNIQKLSLFACINITDITPLQTTKDIQINYCDGILDYRNALTYSHRIQISSPNPEAVIDVSCFRAVQNLILDLSGINIAPDLSLISVSSTLIRLRIGGRVYPPINYFDHLQELTITYSTVLTSLDAFGCIPILRLLNLPNVESLHGLGYDDDITKKRRNRVVSISELGKVQDFTPLNSIPTVAIRKCEGFVDLGQVKDVKNLSVVEYENLFPPLVALKTEQFFLGGKITFNPLPYFPNVKELDLSDVREDTERGLEGLETLMHLERIVIASSWEEQNTKGWEVLRVDYSKFVSSRSSSTYVKKAKS